MSFDYYGSPDIPLHAMVPCIDLSQVWEKDPGYVYTCFAQINEVPFGPTPEHADAQDVEACCMSKSPDEAVDPFCRIDAAHDMCVTASNQPSSEARLKNGRVDIREAECDVDACTFELAALELTVASFELDGMRLTDVSAVLVEPARGKLHGELVRISGSKVELDVRGQRWAGSREFWGLAGVQTLGEFVMYDADLWRKASADSGFHAG